MSDPQPETIQVLIFFPPCTNRYSNSNFTFTQIIVSSVNSYFCYNFTCTGSYAIVFYNTVTPMYTRYLLLL